MNFPRLSDYKEIAIDVETTGLSWYKDEIFSIALSAGDNDYYWDIRREPKVLDWLHDETKVYKGKIVNHNIKFDVHFLRQAGIDLINNDLRCTMVRAQLIDENLFEYDLDSVGNKYLGISKVDPYQELADLFGGVPTRNVQIKNLPRAPESIVAPYAKKDTRNALLLYLWQEEEIKKQELQRVCALEDAVLPVLIKMEARGIRVDVEKAQRNMKKLEVIISNKQKEINKEVGAKFNINSTPQIREFFKPERIGDTNQFRLIDGTIASATKGGNPSIGSETLQQMDHPLAAKIIELRTAIKIHGTFLRDQILGYQVDGRIYPNFKQCGTVNGRFSASQPALQAIPKRNKEMSALTRSVFLPEEGEEMLRCDFEQSDFRGFVHYTESAPLIAAYRNDPMTDFHTLVAELLDIPRNPQKGGGKCSKQINLGSIFGMGVGKLAKTMGLPYTEEISSKGKVWLKPGPEAEEVFQTYHSNIPGVEEFNKKASGVARSRGYVISICGRHLRFPNKNLTYKAPGYLYSSFTSDLMKSAMVATNNIADVRLSIHDELLFSINNRGVTPLIQKAMQECLGDLTTIPIRTNPEIGPSWFDCKPIKE